MSRVVRWMGYDHHGDKGYPFRLMVGLRDVVSLQRFNEMKCFCLERGMRFESIHKPLWFSFERDQDRTLFRLAFSDVEIEE